MRYAAHMAIVLACSIVRAQAPLARPQFEVASVRPAAKDEMGGDRLSQTMRAVGRNQRRPGQIPMTGPNRIRLKNWALLDLIAAAYSVRATQVSGPAWLSDQVFDIEAKLPDGAPKEELNAMLQCLLEERFGLKVHRSTQTRPALALKVGKDGPKLKPAIPGPAPAQELNEEEQRAQVEKLQAGLAAMRKRSQETLSSGTPLSAFISESWRSITPEEIAAQLVRFADAPVIDQTALTGAYSVTIEISKNADGPTVFDAVEKLGLKLEPRKVTIETLVVDQVSKTPTAN